MQAIVGRVVRVYSPSFERRVHTRISRSASGFIWVYCVMFPSGIHGLMMQNGNRVSEISMMGSKFGWEMRPLIPRRKI